MFSKVTRHLQPSEVAPINRRLWRAPYAWMAIVILCTACDRKSISLGRPAAPIHERALANAPKRQQAIPQPESTGVGLASNELPLFELKMSRADLARMAQSPWSNDTHPATLIVDGKSFEGAQVRHRGDWARSWPKKPLKIFLPKGQSLDGQNRFNLNPGWRDPAFVRELLAYHVYAACGVPSPRARPVRLQVNGSFYGLYLEIEQPDKVFLERTGMKGAMLFKADSPSKQSDERNLGTEASYSTHYKQETQKTEGYGELRLFCEELAATTNTLDFFLRRVDVDRYINYLAATVLVQNWDCYNKNHFLACDVRGSRRWLAIPWDLDRTFGDHWRGSFSYTQMPVLHGTQQLPGTTGWNRLADRFFSEPTLRGRFLNRLNVLLDKEFTREKLFPLLDRIEAEIRPDVERDRRKWPGNTGDVHSGIAQVKTYIEQRRQFLKNEVQRMRGNPL